MVSSWGIATGKLCCRKMHLMQTVMVLGLEQFIQTVQCRKNFCLDVLTIPDCCERRSPTNKWRRYGQSDQSGGRLPTRPLWTIFKVPWRIASALPSALLPCFANEEKIIMALRYCPLLPSSTWAFGVAIISLFWLSDAILASQSDMERNGSSLMQSPV